MEREWPLVSIAMPCYNRGSNLEKFIANIRKQSYPQDKIEIVLADFYSEDNTYEVAQKNGCIILRDHNPDMEYRRTLALKNCSGEYIFIAVNDNFFVNPDLIKNMVTVIEDEVQVQLSVYGNIMIRKIMLRTDIVLYLGRLILQLITCVCRITCRWSIRHGR